MRKSTIAAVMAASLVGFGTVGSASAHMEWSGFGDVNMNVYSGDDEEGNFFASGELDVMQKSEDSGPTFRGDFDLNNCHNRSAAVDLPTGTDPGLDATGSSLDCGVGVDIEQLRVDIPVNDMATVTAGIFNSFHGMEGQDATDLDFAANGLLWDYVPSNVAGGMVEVTPTDMVSVKVGYINRWTDLAQASYLGGTGAAGTDAANDVIAGVWVGPMEGLDVNVSYLTDETEAIGDELDINATVSMIENLTLAAEYLMADPATGAGGNPSSVGGVPSGFDNGWGIDASYVFGPITAAGRYEAATYEGTGPDTTEGSVAVSYDLAAGTLVRLDFTSLMVDKFDNNDTVTLQLVHTFDGMGTM
jgi:hypothetical protein